MSTVDVERVANALNAGPRRVQQLVKEGMPREKRGGASRKTVLNVLSTLSAMHTKAKDWHYAARNMLGTAVAGPRFLGTLDQLISPLNSTQN